ncbi:SCP2 sterol-binding domain-containing protein [Rubrivirga sp.]|uniref:SCP2 sterol-binding domain-containing protein n=1 Tax=Rubrivirga sp. TaxID=1885344 RepID=UPI003C7807E4
MPAFFSPAWASAVCDALNASESYREAARTWDGAIRFVARTDGDGLEVWLDLRHGECHGTKTGEDASTAEAPFEIAASRAVWDDVLAQTLDPVMGMMLGKLKLTGSMAQIASHAKAAKALVACAASVETTKG